MDWISKLEKKFGKYAIQNLPIVIVAAYAIGYIIYIAAPAFYAQYLCLNVDAILHGQIWRIITFIVQPPSTSIIFIIFVLYLYYMIGTSLSNAWGAFRFNLYFWAGVLFHVIGAFIAYFVTYLITGTGINFALNTEYLNLSMFFAFAMLFPDVRLLLFFVIPLKIKWLALIDGVFFLYTIIRGFMPASLLHQSQTEHIYYMGIAIAATVSILNFLIFALGSKNHNPYKNMQKKQEMNRRKEQYYKQVQSARQAQSPDGARHRCTICGRTDITNPELDFRYCSKCSGAHEYCQDHLFTHVHIQ